MIRVTYVSREAPGLTSDKLLALVSQCHRNNPDKVLTGMCCTAMARFCKS